MLRFSCLMIFLYNTRSSFHHIRLVIHHIFVHHIHFHEELLATGKRGLTPCSSSGTPTVIPNTGYTLSGK